jgi:RNA polymerase sigma-70 factor (ECF subfamily)
MQVFKKYHSYDSAKPILPWIYKIALNITRKTLRKQKCLFLTKEAPDTEGLNLVEDVVLKNELDEELWKEINKLTPKSQEIIVMHYYSGLKLNEIATVLGIPLGTCKSRLNTALTSLGKQLHSKNIVLADKGEDLYGTI